MILTSRQIRDAIATGSIAIDPYDEGQVQPATYDLRVGPQGVTTTTRELVDVKAKGLLTLAPGDFAVLTALEKLTLDNRHVARFGLRSKYARRGLLATTGPQIDPGYSGRLTVGLTNLRPKPITLAYGDDFLSVEFHRLREPAEPYSGPFQGRDGLRPEDIEFVTEGTGMAYSEVLETLRSVSASVATLSSAVGFLKWALSLGFTVLALMMTGLGFMIALTD